MHKCKNTKRKSKRPPPTIRDYKFYYSCPSNYVSVIFTANEASTDLCWYAWVFWLLAQNDNRLSAMPWTIKWVFKLHIQRCWTRSTICRLRIKSLKGKQERRENMYTCFHVRGDWTALTRLVRFFFWKMSSQSLDKLVQYITKFTVTVIEQRSFNSIIFPFMKVMPSIATHRFPKTRYLQKIQSYTSMQCKLVGKWWRICPSLISPENWIVHFYAMQACRKMMAHTSELSFAILVAPSWEYSYATFVLRMCACANFWAAPVIFCSVVYFLVLFLFWPVDAKYLATISVQTWIFLGSARIRISGSSNSPIQFNSLNPGRCLRSHHCEKSIFE